MIGLVLLPLLVAHPTTLTTVASAVPIAPIARGAQDLTIVVGGALDRSAVLQRDPRLLPRADAGKWKEFDVARSTVGTIAERIGGVRVDMLAGDLVAALAGLYALLEAEPDFPPALHMTGVLYYRLQRYGDSAYLLERYVALLPERIGDTRVLGHDLYTLGRYAEARAHYAKVLTRAPDDVEARRGLALTLWRLGEEKAALAELETALAIAPRNDDLWSWKATIAFDAGDHALARQAAEQALALDAFEPRTWFVFARILDELDQATGAEGARARFAQLSAAAAAVRGLEARLLFAPDRADLLADWTDACIAWGSGARIRIALERLNSSRAAQTLAGRAARLRAEVALGHSNAARELAGQLEPDAGDDRRAWIALLDWFSAQGDEAGQVRAQAHLAR